MIINPNYIIVLGLIITALGTYFLNKNTDKSFDEVKDERSDLKNKLNIKFEKTSEEMRLHKDSLNSKVEIEAANIITERKVFRS
ncbi:hypothetical protein SAMN05428642_102825 [Flaviramulus basaltis]|uniref:Uncharacterized protein n=1 Tax=Flaviramulus basaltis TaxID=369401 RepID=A0A1K2IK16_9FLAO|nr:hypothetical protein [Flaviramulus basaltis]SFZ92610.1 hypothetical protein SAMN05428642_102825 [Flaviramulus basaltis]